MKQLKVTITAALMILSVSAFAAPEMCTDKKKKHKCNTECKAGKHKYMHGEKKHKCGDECHKMMDKKM